MPDESHLAAKAAADVQVLAPGSVRVNLTLRDVELKDLTPAARPDAELHVAFATAANREFDGLITALYGINGPDADPLDLCFWCKTVMAARRGAAGRSLPCTGTAPAKADPHQSTPLFAVPVCHSAGQYPAKTKKQIENSPERQ